MFAPAQITTEMPTIHRNGEKSGNGQNNQSIRSRVCPLKTRSSNS
jgi:hypothetical protein